MHLVKFWATFGYFLIKLSGHTGAVAKKHQRSQKSNSELFSDVAADEEEVEVEDENQLLINFWLHPSFADDKKNALKLFIVHAAQFSAFYRVASNLGRNKMVARLELYILFLHGDAR